jgi:hypothetical protein
MLEKFAAIGLGAAIALAPLAALAESAPPPATHHHRAVHQPTRSHRNEMRQRHNASKDRARAGAAHVRTMRQQ